MTLSRDLPSSPISNHVGITSLLALALIAAACAYPIPTAPSAVAAAPASAPRSVAWVTITAGAPDFLSARANVSATAFDSLGNPIQDAEVNCSAAAGNLRPARGFGSVHGFLSDATTPTLITCSAGGVSASTTADMSAWSIDLLASEWHPYQRDGVTTVYVDLRKRLSGMPPATSMYVDWGDGTRSHHSSPPIEFATTMLHHYAREGFHQATATVTWNGGSASQTRTIYGGPSKALTIVPPS